MGRTQGVGLIDVLNRLPNGPIERGLRQFAWEGFHFHGALAFPFVYSVPTSPP